VRNAGGIGVGGRFLCVGETFQRQRAVCRGVYPQTLRSTAQHLAQVTAALHRDMQLLVRSGTLSAIFACLVILEAQLLC
jgi:hypothetical protein